jgi:hypothetical protein
VQLTLTCSFCPSQPVEAATSYVFLASQEAAFMTGQVGARTVQRCRSPRCQACWAAAAPAARPAGPLCGTSDKATLWSHNECNSNSPYVERFNFLAGSAPRWRHVHLKLKAMGNKPERRGAAAPSQLCRASCDAIRCSHSAGQSDEHLKSVPCVD